MYRFKTPLNSRVSVGCGKSVYFQIHYGDVIMGAMASQITSLTIVYSTVNSGTDQRKHQSSASLAFMQRIHRWPVNSPHKGPVIRKMLPFDDVIMCDICLISWYVVSNLCHNWPSYENTLLGFIRPPYNLVLFEYALYRCIAETR